jgi:hypothetical protein
MKKVWQHVLGKPYLLYEDPKPSVLPAVSSIQQEHMDSGRMISEEAQNLVDPSFQVRQRFDECTSLEEKFAWVESAHGQKIIQSLPLVAQYYKSGYLFKLLENPFWEQRLKDWLSPELVKSGSSVPHGLGLPRTDEEIEKNRGRGGWIHPPHENPPLQVLFEEYYKQFYFYTIPEDNRMELFTRGFTVVPNVIQQELVDAAAERINEHILNTDCYFDILHNEKNYSKELKDKKDKDKKSSFSSFFSKKKDNMKEKDEGTVADNPFLGTKEKQKIRLEHKKLVEEGDRYFVSGSTNDLAVLSLYYASPLHAMVESLLHGSPSQYTEKMIKSGQSLPVPPPVPGRGTQKKKDNNNSNSFPEIPHRPFRTAVGDGQIAYRFAQPTPTAAPSKEEYLQKNFQNLTNSDPILNIKYDAIGGQSWHVDGLGRGYWGTFSLLIGIPLSDQFEEYSGNLCLHDGSHVLLQPYMREYAAKWNSAESFDEKFALQRSVKKPLLEEPTQVIASRGDVVIALHKVAHLGGPNYSNDIRKMLYFRVSHQRHGELRLDALDDLWIEYEGMHDILHGK